MDNQELNEHVLDASPSEAALQEAVPQEAVPQEPVAQEVVPQEAQAAADARAWSLPPAEGSVSGDGSDGCDVGLAETGDSGGISEANDAAQLRKVQRQRIVEHLENSLARIDPVEANLGAVIANLLMLQLDLYRTLMERMPDAVADSDEWDTVLRSLFEPYLRVTKQLDRFMAVEMKLRHQGRAQAARSHPS